MPGTARVTAPPLLRDLLGGRVGPAQDDEALLARFARDRDEAAFAALVARHGPLVLSTARAILRHERDAEDAFQVTFLALARRAPAIRSGATLAAWLHRVAHRAAVRAGRAARRRRLAEVAAAIPGPTRPADPDHAAAVHAALDRLPRPYRLAVVLCDLEGHTYAEAAARLACTEAALRNRLARARARLRATLGRFDLAALALPRLAVPPSWVRATTALVLGHAPTAPAVLALARSGRRLGSIRWQPAVLSWLTAVGVAAGFVAAVAAYPAVDSAVSPVPVPAPPPAAIPAAPRTDDTQVVRGRVVGPDGRPVAGAEVVVRSGERDQDTWPAARSGGDGRYDLTIGPEWRTRRAAQPRATLSATAPGFGAGWAPLDLTRADTEIRLAAEGPPIEGRVLDEVGRPVAGARVIVRTIHAPPPRDPAELPAAAFDRLLVERGGFGRFERIPVAIQAATAGNGRFILRGVGADRIATLEVSGPTIATTEVEVMTRGGAERRLEQGGFHGGEQRVLHPNRFDWTVPPTRIITGTVRDADSGAPLVGWRVAGSYQDEDTLGAGETWGRTDSAGRYRIVGLPAVASYALRLLPPPGQPYLDAFFDLLAPAEGGAPVDFDVRLRRGVVVRGRVTDRVTGRPVAGSVSVLPYPGDPFRADYPEFEKPNYWAVKDAPDGRYELVAPSARSLILVRAAGHDRYRLGQGAAELPGLDPDGRRVWLQPRGTILSTDRYNALLPLDVPPGAQATRFDIQLVPEPGLDLTLLDPAGRPLDAAESLFVASPRFVLLEGTRLLMPGTRPGHVWRVIAWHAGRKLVGSFDAVADGPPQVVPLAPWGEVRGRVVGPDGAPRGDAPLSFQMPAVTEPRIDWTGALAKIADRPLRTDPEGRFHLIGLVPGTRYNLMAGQRRSPSQVDLLDDLTVAPGEIRDLGDITVRPDEPPPPRP